MKKTKIDWCDCTINPVVGCKNGCEYCYARKLNDRFHFVDNWCELQFFPDRLDQLKSKKSKSIFMNSMSDIAFWEEEWVKKVIKAITYNPQHNYIFLTKSSAVPYDLFYAWEFGLIKNIFLGKTITKNSQIYFTDSYNFDFLSIEPILEEINLPEKPTPRLKLLIIGAETGNRKGKTIPKKEWIDKLVKFADEHGLSVFMKSSLKKIMGDDFRQDKLIWRKHL